MADLKESIVDGLKIRRPASAADEAVRKGELDAALAGKANQAEVAQQITEATHHPVTTPANQTLELAVDADQSLTGEVRLPAETILQAAASGLIADFQHPVAPMAIFDLGRTLVSNANAQRLNASGGVLATGTGTIDYTVDPLTGLVTVLAGNLVTSATEIVRVTFDCAQVLDGPALQKTADGLAVKLGTTHETAARGDHSHANDHRPASGSTGAVVNVAVDANQRIAADVNLAPASGLTKVSGLAVDLNQVAAKTHTHPDVSDAASGLMTPAQKAQLDSLLGQASVTVADTDTVQLSRDSEGSITADVRQGFGLDSDADGLKVDTAQIAVRNHSHNVTTGIKEVDVTSGGSGYTAATVNFTGGDGSSAAAHAVIVNGEITRIILDNPGYGYTVAPDVEIAGDGAGASAVAFIELGAGFACPAMVDALKSHGTRLDGHDAQIAQKADKVYVDAQNNALQTAVNGKANATHIHTEADVTGLTADLASLAAALDDKAGTNHTHLVATPTSDGFMAAADKDTFNCLRRILNVQSEALQVMASLRLESPMTGANFKCAMTLDSDSIVIGGEAGQTYDIKIRVRGVTEVKDYAGGVTTGRINIGGTPADNPHNLWKLVISDPAQTIYLNVAQAGETGGDTTVVALDYETTIQAACGATVSLSMDSRDAMQKTNPGLAVPGVAPYPAAYDGQFIQVDATEVTNYCSFKFLFGDASTTPTLGGTDTRQPPGTTQPGSEPPGTPGGTNIIDITRDLQRVDLIEDGEANGDVTEILVDGDTIWVGGDFSRWANINSWGLAKLDNAGNYDPIFLIGGGFSAGVRFIRKAGNKVLVGTARDSLFQGSQAERPAWMVNDDGSVDSSFTCPFVLNEAGSTAYGTDRLIGAALLASGNILLLTPNVLTLLDPTGTIILQKTGTDQFNSILSSGEKAYLSSLAYSAAGIEQKYDGEANPKGLRLVNFTNDPTHPQDRGEVDAVWALYTNAGTGANSACGQIVAGPDGKYVIVGNALTGFNSPDTSWNTEQKGNLLLRSEEFENPAWTAVGALTVTANSTAAPDGTQTADMVADTDGTQLAYLYQDVAVENGTRYVFSLYVRKDTDQTRFPLFRLEYRGGTAENDTFVYLNTQTGAWAIGGTMGPDVADTSLEVLDAGNYWRVRFKATNAKDANTLRVYLYPAYTYAWGSPAVTITGSCILWGAQARKDSWYDDYVATTSTAIVPASTGSNANQFRGLYKILANGKADPDWHCNITLDGEGYVIPFAIDDLERVYVGGPVTSIDGNTVVPWRLYRLTKNGAFDREYRHFTDQVLVARITSLGQLAVGGKFTNYGAVKVGRFIILNLDGSIASSALSNSGDIVTGTPGAGGTSTTVAVPIIASDIEPNVSANPKLKDYAWLDISTDPPTFKSYYEVEQRWVDCCFGKGGMGTKLPSVTFSPLTGAAPLQVTLAVPGFPGAIIRYTRGANPPDANSDIYTGPLAVSGAETINAYATFAGYLDSSISSANYQAPGTQTCPPVSFDPPSGTLTPVSIQLSTTLAGATIHYSTDNGATWTDYSGAIAISNTTTLQAYASHAGYTDGPILSAIYLNNAATSRIVNVQFKSPSTAAKQGQAVIGHSTTDFWNCVESGALALSAMKDADGSAVPWDLTVQAAPSGAMYGASIEAAANDNLLKAAYYLVAGASRPDVIAYWKLDAATVTKDEGANVFTLTAQASTTTTTGKIAEGVFLQDPNSHLIGPTNAALDLADTDFTIRFWYYESGLGATGGDIILAKQGSNGGWTISRNDGWSIGFQYRDSTGALSTNLWGYIVNTGWNHVVITHNQATRVQCIYINNQLKLGNTPAMAIGHCSQALQVGPVIPDYSWQVAGCSLKLDEIGIWPVAWTASEVTADYNGGAGVTYASSAAAAIPWTARILNVEPGTYDVYGYGADLEIYAEPSGSAVEKTASNMWADSPWVEGTQYNRWMNVEVKAGDCIRVNVKGANPGLHGLQIIAASKAASKIASPIFSPANGVAAAFDVLADPSVAAPYSLYASVNGAAFAPVTGPIALTPGVRAVVEAYGEKAGYLASDHVTTTYNQLPPMSPEPWMYIIGISGGVSGSGVNGSAARGSFSYNAAGPHLAEGYFQFGVSEPWPADARVQVVGKEDISGTTTGAPMGSNTMPYRARYYIATFTDGAVYRLTFKISRTGFADCYAYGTYRVRRIVT